LSKRNVEEPIDSVINKTPKRVVEIPLEKENCSYFRNIFLKRKEIARELALLSTDLDRLTGSAAQLMEKLILRDLSCKLGLEYRKGNRGFCSIHREVGVGDFC
jgi:hypothetical protein